MTDNLLKWFFFLQCQLLLLLVYSTQGIEGGADAVCHWMISHDAPTHPMLFLDQWNKPIFTLLSAPFAQFGLLGMRIFSGITGILTAYVLFRSVEETFGRIAWLPAVLLMLIPQYLVLLTSSMTEPLFALFLSLFVLSVSKNRLGWAAVVAGFSPFVRQEGMALMLVAIIVLILLKKPKKLPWLGFGTLTFTLIGWFSSGNIDWILTSFPYGSESADIYGSGSLFHYLSHYRVLFGIPISILFVVGAAWLMASTTKKLLEQVRLSPQEIAILAAFVFALMFFLAHSFIWWKGMSGSLGLIRVMACIAPAIALVAAYAVKQSLDFAPLKKAPIQAGISLVLVIVAAVETYALTQLPSEPEQSQIAMRRSCGWLVERGVTGKVHYYNPVFAYYANGELNIDSPINKSPLRPDQVNQLAVGDVIVWDAHFGPNEGRTPLDSLIRHPYLKEIRSFKPDQPFTVLGGNPYSVNVFQKVEKPIRKAIVESVIAVEDFENPSNEFLIADEGRNSSKCAVADSQHEYVTLRSQLKRSSLDSVMSFKLEAWIRSDVPIDENRLFLVSDVSGYHYLSTDATKASEPDEEGWMKLSQSFVLAGNLPERFEVGCYIWNPNGLNVQVDDLKFSVTYLSQTEQ
ncbi:MAG: hypothetical protein H6602_01445 [Flavobacteriales bacterium]|nr:hypothetical protein [Flavobacteriales bacterium]MCB9190316.1 hypothetical protein [Flavobacteriales bacterium]